MELNTSIYPFSLSEFVPRVTNVHEELDFLVDVSSEMRSFKGLGEFLTSALGYCTNKLNFYTYDTYPESEDRVYKMHEDRSYVPSSSAPVIVFSTFRGLLGLPESRSLSAQLKFLRRFENDSKELLILNPVSFEFLGDTNAKRLQFSFEMFDPTIENLVSFLNKKS